MPQQAPSMLHSAGYQTDTNIPQANIDMSRLLVKPDPVVEWSMVCKVNMLAEIQSAKRARKKGSLDLRTRRFRQCNRSILACMICFRHCCEPSAPNWTEVAENQPWLTQYCTSVQIASRRGCGPTTHKLEDMKEKLV